MPIGTQEQLDAVVGRRYHVRMLATLRPLITEALVEEHRCAPFGPHSDALQRVLNYFGSFPIDGKLIAEHDGVEHWYVCRLSGFPPERVDRIAGPFGTEAAAMDAVFRQRLVDVFGLDFREPTA
jgi:branched-chain amino acid transport system permease protein